ncbi:acylphosphatase [Nitrospirales bacterium NOB]|nr:MAG: acylphosphatase [Nitrospira sp. OLB3]MBV6471659.1 Acylphosphatase [Nitrospirota bacterium]MCE7966933.1 acylphosphatase [Nitrospira sp. NTP2]MDL1890474.1 acylphosphatase [Nitrospirales bacterium NOB]MEB2337198.1 acylphosphatase [Nitrospirales bacterium]QOJ34440.1 MAG: acylphosphatase [Nitrospira sp.]
MVEPAEQVRAKILVSGHVQGVGYRAFTRRMAISRGLTGGVENLDSGQVALVVEGKKTLLEDLITDLKKGPVGARVVQVQVEWSQATGRYIDFAIW